MADHTKGKTVFTLSYRDILPASKNLYIQISTGKNTAVHILNRSVIGQGEQLGIRLLKSPHFVPGNRAILPICLDDSSQANAETIFYSDSTEVSGGTLIEETMIPKFAFSFGGTPVEYPHFERVLKAGTDYMLIIKNEGFSTTDVVLNIAFYETEV